MAESAPDYQEIGGTESVSVDRLKLDLPEVARSLGYRPTGTGAAQDTPSKREIPTHMTEVATEQLAQSRELLDPHWSWRAIPIGVDSQRDVLICRSPFEAELQVGRIVRAQLRGAEAIAAFVVTIGSKLENAARELMTAGKTVEGYVLDTIGSAATEALADVLEKEIAATVAARGWKITNRFSPGYCSWETGGQQALFSLFPDQPAGVTLNESSLMSPIKSVSGVIGLGPSVEHRPYACDMCGMTTCHQRLTQARL